MRKRLLSDISYLTLQTVLNHVFGLAVFILLSRFLLKDIYGELNWSAALCLSIFAILSFRLEQVVVKKVAAGENASRLLSLFTGHVWLGGLFIFLAAGVAHLVNPDFFVLHSLLPLYAISQLISFWAIPFRHIINGREAYRWLAAMNTIGILVKAIGLALMWITNELEIKAVLYLFIFSSLLEWLLGFYIVRFKLGISLSTEWGWKSYKALLHESLPQIGVVVLNALIARLDWIMLGIIGGTLITADYSFAYRVFELSPLPMLILAPLLLTRFSGYFSRHNEQQFLEKKEDLNRLLRFQMIAATLIPLVLVMIWIPLMDALTDDKYGKSAFPLFLILSFCIPLQYLINLMWTIEFAQGRFKRIFKITLLTTLFMIAVYAWLIPTYKAVGAAIGYGVTSLVECLLFYQVSVLRKLTQSLLAPLISIGAAVLAGWVGYALFGFSIIAALVAVIVYLFILILTGQLQKKDLVFIWQLYKGRHE